jgi:hypothetical protein
LLVRLANYAVFKVRERARPGGFPGRSLKTQQHADAQNAPFAYRLGRHARNAGRPEDGAADSIDRSSLERR